MTRSVRTLVTAAGVVCGVVAGGAAEAAFVAGSFGFTQFGPVEVDNGDFSAATRFTLPPNGPTTPFVNVAGTGDYAPLTAGTVGAVAPTTFSNGGGNTLTFGGFTFTVLGGFLTRPDDPSDDPNELSFTGFGAVTGGGFDPSLFTVNISVVRNPGSLGVPETINASAVVSSPGLVGPQAVPEPAALALAGAGVAGLIGLARRRKAATA